MERLARRTCAANALDSALDHVAYCSLRRRLHATASAGGFNAEKWKHSTLLMVGSILGILYHVMYGAEKFDASSMLLNAVLTHGELLDDEILSTSANQRPRIRFSSSPSESSSERVGHQIDRVASSSSRTRASRSTGTTTATGWLLERPMRQCTYRWWWCRAEPVTADAMIY